MASPSAAAALAAAALASRRSGPAVRGRLLAERSPAAAMAAVPSTSAAAPALLAGTSSDLLLSSLKPLPAVSSSQPQPAAPVATAALTGVPPRPCSVVERVPVSSVQEQRPQLRPAAPAAASPTPPCSHSAPLSDAGLGSDPAMLIEGLGFLSLPPTASGGPVPTGVCSVVEEDEEFTTRLASSKGVLSNSEEVILEPCCDLSAVAVVDDEKGWIQVGRGGRPVRAPLSPLRKEVLDRSLAFKH